MESDARKNGDAHAGTDVFESITARIVALLEAGRTGGSITWKGQGESGRIPYNLKTGAPYSGANVLALWIAALDAGYGSNAWMTFKQARDLGGNVRKGEKCTVGIYFDKVERPDRNAESPDATVMVPFAKAFRVFNLDQVEGVDRPDPRTGWDPLVRAEEVIAKSGAAIIEGGTRAYYVPADDRIRMPDRNRFSCPENFYAVNLHELTHWTGHPSRLARDLRNRFGSDPYAMEELVAELGAAFLCAETGVEGKLENHANYVESWLGVLTHDKRAVVTAAAAAGKAANFVLARAAAGEESGEMLKAA
jgi:antirestriction protein ArdC